MHGRPQTAESDDEQSKANCCSRAARRLAPMSPIVCVYGPFMHVTQANMVAHSTRHRRYQIIPTFDLCENRHARPTAGECAWFLRPK